MPKTKPRHASALPNLIVQRIKRAAPNCPHILLGPVVWTIEPHQDRKTFYFALVYGQTNHRNQFSIEQIKQPPGRPRADLDALRSSLPLHLVPLRPCVIHDCDDELVLAKWLEACFPGPRAASIRQSLERERATSPHDFSPEKIP